MAWLRVASSEELSNDSSMEVLVAGEVIAIFRANHKLFAVDGICAHQGGPLSRGKVSEDCVTCPWHGWRYHLATGNNANTDKPMLRAYAIREINGQIELSTDLISD